MLLELYICDSSQKCLSCNDKETHPPLDTILKEELPTSCRPLWFLNTLQYRKEACNHVV